MTDLHIVTFDERCRVSGSADDGEAVRRQLLEAYSSDLDRAIEAAFGPMLERLGLSEEAEIAVRSVDLSLRVDDVGRRAAELLSEAICEELEPRVEGALRRRNLPAPDDDLVVFDSRAHAEALYVVRRTERRDERPGEWWWPHVLGADSGQLPSTADVLRRWARGEPARGPELIVDALAETRGALLEALSQSAAVALADALLAHRLDHGELASRPPQRQDATIRRGARLLVERLTPHEGALLDDLRTPTLRETPTAKARADLAVAALAARHVPSLKLGSTRKLERLRGEVFRLGVDVQANRAHRSDRRTSPAVHRSGSRSPGDDGDRRKADNAGPAQEERTTSDAPLFEPAEESATEFDPAPTAEAVAASEPAPLRPTDGQPVMCAGLLFCLHPLQETDLWQIQNPARFERQIITVGQLLLERVLAPLSAERRHAEFERARPLLEVFAGRAELPDDLTRPLADQTAPGHRYVDHIAACLPVEVSEQPACASLFGEIGAEGDATDRSLRRLVVREGRLVLGTTHAELLLPMRSADITVRRLAWDVDPGWAPRLGRIIRLHYVDDFDGNGLFPTPDAL